MCFVKHYSLTTLERGDMKFKIVAECKKGHSQILHVEGMDRKSVELQAGLIDGTSPFYLYPPDETSVIGKCGFCGRKFICSVYEDDKWPARTVARGRR